LEIGGLGEIESLGENGGIENGLEIGFLGI